MTALLFLFNRYLVKKSAETTKLIISNLFLKAVAIANR
jgi:hypothetical protein